MLSKMIKFKNNYNKSKEILLLSVVHKSVTTLELHLDKIYFKQVC